MDVILLKALGASLAFGLAVLNLLIMLQLYGKVRLFPWTPPGRPSRSPGGTAVRET